MHTALNSLNPFIVSAPVTETSVPAVVKITANELKALNGILNSDYRDGGDPVGRHVWSWSANTFDSQRSFGGVVASLQKKGLVKVGNSGTEDATIAMTEAGFNALLACHAEGTDGYNELRAMRS